MHNSQCIIGNAIIMLNVGLMLNVEFLDFRTALSSMRANLPSKSSPGFLKFYEMGPKMW